MNDRPGQDFWGLDLELARRIDEVCRRGRQSDIKDILLEVPDEGRSVLGAELIALNRPFALKMTLAGQIADDDAVRRFHIDGEAAANLGHPGIVPIAIGADDYSVKACDAKTGQATLTLKGHTARVTTVNFSPEGRLLASVGLDGIRVWDVRPMENGPAITGHAPR